MPRSCEYCKVHCKDLYIDICDSCKTKNISNEITEGMGTSGTLYPESSPDWEAVDCRGGDINCASEDESSSLCIDVTANSGRVSGHQGSNHCTDLSSHSRGGSKNNLLQPFSNMNISDTAAVDGTVHSDGGGELRRACIEGTDTAHEVTSARFPMEESDGSLATRSTYILPDAQVNGGDARNSQSTNEAGPAVLVGTLPSPDDTPGDLDWSQHDLYFSEDVCPTSKTA